MILQDNEDAFISRQEAHSGLFSLLGSIYVEPGTIDDWHGLKELHYKAENLGIGPQFYRVVLDGQTIGCMVMTVPKMLLSGRNEVMPHMRPNTNGRDSRIINRHRAIWANANMCTNSRLVLDTMFRGAGIAYRFQNLVCRMSGVRFVEFQSSMSKFNPFASKCGFKFIKPKRSSFYEKGLAFFRRHFTCIPSDHVGVLAELDAMPDYLREKVIKEMRGFYYKCSSMEKSGDNRMNGTSRVDSMPVPYLVKQLQQVVFASPLYGIFENPDFGRDLPERLPLLAFDNQAPTEPLKLELL